MKPEVTNLTDAIVKMVQSGLLSIPFIIFGALVLLVMVMWVIFPLIMYSQLNSVQSLLLKIHADLIELNLRVKEGLEPKPPVRESRGVEDHPGR